MTSIFNVAEYILELEGPMTPMKLQRLCYYSQAWSLAWNKQPLFDDDFYAWASGPVCEVLFNALNKILAAKFDSEEEGCVMVKADEMSEYCSEKGLTDGQVEIIEYALNVYADKSASWLRNLSIMEDPWKDAAKPGASPVPRIVSKEAMAEYYRCEYCERIAKGYSND